MNFFKSKYPYINENNTRSQQFPNNNNYLNDERFGGFLLPFLTGAVVSAPFWYIGANNKAQQQQCCQQMTYQNQPYPMYYPYQSTNQQYPYYFPYPNYR